MSAAGADQSPMSKTLGAPACRLGAPVAQGVVAPSTLREPLPHKEQKVKAGPLCHLRSQLCVRDDPRVEPQN